MADKFCISFLSIIFTAAACASSNSIDVSGSPKEGFTVQASLNGLNINTTGLDTQGVIATIKLIGDIKAMQADAAAQFSGGTRQVRVDSHVTVTTSHQPARAIAAEKPVSSTSVLAELLQRHKQGLGLKRTEVADRKKQGDPGMFASAIRKIRVATAGDDGKVEWEPAPEPEQSVFVQHTVKVKEIIPPPVESLTNSQKVTVQNIVGMQSGGSAADDGAVSDDEKNSQYYQFI